MWQPIETAPMNGTRVLLYEDGKMCVGAWRLWYRCYKPDPDKCAWFATWGDMELHDAGEFDPGYLIISPTHWMPLPAQPTIKPEHANTPP